MNLEREARREEKRKRKKARIRIRIHLMHFFLPHFMPNLRTEEYFFLVHVSQNSYHSPCFLDRTNFVVQCVCLSVCLSVCRDVM
jgi:hypothetical protein